MNFRLRVRDQVVLLEIAAIFSSFELGRIIKDLMSGPAGNGEFYVPLTLMCPSASPRETLRISGKQNSRFPWGQSLSAF